MAIFKQGTLIGPSTDYRTLTELEDVTIESGLYYCIDTKTITASSISITADKWAVLCISNDAKAQLHCLMQIWVPADSTVRTSVTPFIRYSDILENTWSDFRAILTDRNAGVQNISDNPDVRMVVSNTQPQAVQGAQIVWIDTSVV